MDARLERATGFERATHAALGRVVTAAWGQAFLERALDRCYDLNFLWGVGDAGGAAAATLDAEAERLMGGAGLGHRRIVLDAPAEARFGADLAALGYTGARHLYMAHDMTPPPVPAAATDVVAIDAVLPAMAHHLRSDDDAAYGRDDLVRAHLLEHSRRYGSAGARERCFVVRDAGEVVAWAKLWTRDGVAQVEDVVCHGSHRGRGYGRAVVAAATRAALAEDPDLVFIVADADDWPKDLYGRLGYAPIGHVGVHTRHAPGHEWGAPRPPG